MTRCPICARDTLVHEKPGLWNCTAPRCRSQFFYEGPPGKHFVNVRTIPWERGSRRVDWRAVRWWIAAMAVLYWCFYIFTH